MAELVKVKTIENARKQKLEIQIEYWTISEGAIFIILFLFRWEIRNEGPQTADIWSTKLIVTS